jgi:hypothetical protein
LRTLREQGGVVNTAIAIAAGKGIIKKENRSLLECNGGPISLTKDWAKYLLRRMDYVKRKATTKTSQIGLEEYSARREEYLQDIRTTVLMEEIPDELVINWDHTGINYVPVSEWTMAKEGSKRVEVAGFKDKRQITAVFGCSLSGDFLPVQLIYQGKTKASLPKFSFPNDWDITTSPKHWANEDTMLQYLTNVLIPYIRLKKQELHLGKAAPSLVIFDQFKGQMTPHILSILETNSIHFVTVPANCTDKLQPLDLSVNKAAKDFLKLQFSEWYSEQIFKNVEDGTSSPTPVNLNLATLKPLGAKWMVSLYDYLKANPHICRNGFAAAGIIDALSKL